MWNSDAGDLSCCGAPSSVDAVREVAKLTSEGTIYREDACSMKICSLRANQAQVERVRSSDRAAARRVAAD